MDDDCALLDRRRPAPLWRNATADAEISQKVLAETLRDLEREGLVTRTVVAQMPAHVEYKLSPHGESVREIIGAMRAWGRSHLERTQDT